VWPVTCPTSVFDWIPSRQDSIGLPRHSLLLLPFSILFLVETRNATVFGPRPAFSGALEYSGWLVTCPTSVFNWIPSHQDSIGLPCHSLLLLPFSVLFLAETQNATLWACQHSLSNGSISCWCAMAVVPIPRHDFGGTSERGTSGLLIRHLSHFMTLACL